MFTSKEETIKIIEEEKNKNQIQNSNHANRILNNIQKELVSALKNKSEFINIGQNDLILKGHVSINTDMLDIVVERLNQAGYKASLNWIDYEYEGSRQINLHIKL
jgi:hypothetical protein